ncbi:MAG: hypothetical protein ACRD5R_03040 [Candidatus Acidiferrales bacterium]
MPRKPLLTNAATLAPGRLPRGSWRAILGRMGSGIHRTVATVAFVCALVLPLTLSADELKLKDGTKISGTIVGFEENSFKVKTSYGYAEVQKDQVISISISGAPKNAAPAPEKSEAKTPAPKPPPAKAEVQAPKIEAQPEAANIAPPPAPKAAAPAVPTAPPPAPKPAAPEPMRESVNGNIYINETYGFRMYKPPDWEIVQGARTVLPGAITALGTDDQSTYLLIGQASMGKSLTADMQAAQERVREVMDNFRPLGETRVTISGIPAVENRFRGSVDNHDWSGVVVIIPHDAHLYTIFGMTLAETDLVQIQENVIARAISSLQFAKP